MTWHFYALLSAVFAALVPILGKIGLSEVDSTLATSIRAVVMAMFIFIVAFSLGKFHNLSGLQGKALLYITLSGIAGALSWLVYFYALKIAPVEKVASVASIDKLSVVFVFIFTILILGTKFSLKAAVGAVLIGIGAILMI